jgi:hypothetical protein
MDYLSVGDPNTVRQGFTDYWKDAGLTTEGEFNAIDWGFDFEADVIIYLNERLGLSIGFGYINGNSRKKTNEMIVWVYPRTYETKMSAIPIVIGVYYSFPISSKARFFLNGGPGYYFAKFSDNFYDESSPTNWYSRKQEASAGGIGFQGGFGFEYDISKNIALVFEGQGRYAKISGFEGERVWSNSNQDGGTREGVLYYYENYYSFRSDWYPIVQIHSGQPNWAEARNAKEAEIDFSGFTIRVGINVRF